MLPWPAPTSTPSPTTCSSFAGAQSCRGRMLGAACWGGGGGAGGLARSLSAARPARWTLQLNAHGDVSPACDGRVSQRDSQRDSQRGQPKGQPKGLHSGKAPPPSLKPSLQPEHALGGRRAVASRESARVADGALVASRPEDHQLRRGGLTGPPLATKRQGRWPRLAGTAARRGDGARRD